MALLIKYKYHVSSSSRKTCRQKAQKKFSWWGALLRSLSRVFCPPVGQTLLNHNENQLRSRHSLYKCVYKIWGFYIIVEAMNAEKGFDYFWLWCRSVSRIEWNSNLNCGATYWMHIYQALNRYLKTRKKAMITSKNPKRAKIIAKIRRIRFLLNKYVDKYTAGHLCTNFEGLILNSEAMIVKMCLTYFWLQSRSGTQLQLKPNSSCHATY